MRRHEKCALHARSPSPSEEFREARVPWYWGERKPRKKGTEYTLPATLAKGAALGALLAVPPCCGLRLRHSLGCMQAGLPPPPHVLQPLTSREPSFMAEPGTVRGMVRLRSPGSETWRALGVGGGGWKVIP